MGSSACHTFHPKDNQTKVMTAISVPRSEQTCLGIQTTKHITSWEFCSFSSALSTLYRLLILLCDDVLEAPPSSPPKRKSDTLGEQRDMKRGKAGTLLQARGQTGKKRVMSSPDSITEDALLLQGQPQSSPLMLQAIGGLQLRRRASRTQFQSLLEKTGWPKPL